MCERFADFGLGHRAPGAFDIRAFGEKKQYAFTADFRYAFKVDDVAVNGREIDFEVARMEHDAYGRGYAERATARYRVADFYELYSEIIA